MGENNALKPNDYHGQCSPTLFSSSISHLLPQLVLPFRSSSLCPLLNQQHVSKLPTFLSVAQIPLLAAGAVGKNPGSHGCHRPCRSTYEQWLYVFFLALIKGQCPLSSTAGGTGSRQPKRKLDKIREALCFLSNFFLVGVMPPFSFGYQETADSKMTTKSRIFHIIRAIF